MSNDNVNRSPFDPIWYQEMFDKYDSTAEYIDKIWDIVKDNYAYPDKDGSRSSVFRNHAITNGSFDEEAVKETLREIYHNSYHALIASNHDTTGFYRWIGSMSDMTLIPNTDQCTFRIPINQVILPSERDSYKRSQFFRKWLKIEDILNNWDIFQFDIKIFINRRVFSEYEIRFDEQVVELRFKFHAHWVKSNHPVYIYKYSTSYSHRALISRELCNNQWKFKLPLKYLGDTRLSENSMCLVSINRILDPKYRRDGIGKLDILGDNLEFFPIVDGCIDMSSISLYNRNLIDSELKEYLWMSITVPKYFHEYPIILPVDLVYRPYRPKFHPVSTKTFNEIKKVKASIEEDSTHQVFYDSRNKLLEKHDDWKQMIRPIVLSDGFKRFPDHPHVEVIAEVMCLRDLCTASADLVEEFRFYLKEKVTKERFIEYTNQLELSFQALYDGYRSFLNRISITQLDEYTDLHNITFKEVLAEIRKTLIRSIWFNPQRDADDNFWKLTSKLIVIPRSLVNKYSNIEVIESIGREYLWDDYKKYKDQLRFQRPVEENDFWIFDYDVKDKVWRPCPTKIKHYFPDIYILDDENVDPQRITKAFFFYADTPNTRKEVIPLEKSSPNWIEDIFKFTINPQATFRDIFMEKFYWMGIESIYKGILMTDHRWELIEYVIDNESYQRFNELFIHSMDPYFKFGIASYLKSEQLNFPFDHAIEKIKESFKLNHLGYNRVVNYERYLENSHIPPYFDASIRIDDTFDVDKHIIKRPPVTFDMRRVYPRLKNIRKDLIENTRLLFDSIKTIMPILKVETYNLDSEKIRLMDESMNDFFRNLMDIFYLIDSLDPNIASIDDFNRIIGELKKYDQLVIDLERVNNEVRSMVFENNIHEFKRLVIDEVIDRFNRFKNYVPGILKIILDFNMEEFMNSTNNLSTYLRYDKVNHDDKSLIYQINQFDDPWTNPVKDARNKLFQSTSGLYGLYDPHKSYNDDEVDQFVDMANTIKEDIANLYKEAERFWAIKKLPKDQKIVDHLDELTTVIERFKVSLRKYYNYRNECLMYVNDIRTLIKKITDGYVAKDQGKVINIILRHLQNIMDNISYIAGKNKADKVHRSLDAIPRLIDKSIGMIEDEKDCFDVLLLMIKEPSVFLNSVYRNQRNIHNIIGYLETMNEPFIEDDTITTYADVYEVNGTKVVDGGFDYVVEDNVYVPNYGVAMVSEVGSNGNVTRASKTPFYGKTFRNPKKQLSLYDTTSINGIGVRVSPEDVIHENIINEDIMNKYLTRIDNIITNIKFFLQTPNPYNNYEYDLVLKRIIKIKDEYAKLLLKYGSHLSASTISAVEALIDQLFNIKDISQPFIDCRERIKLKKIYNRDMIIIKMIDELPTDVTDPFKDTIENMKIAFHKLDEYVENPSMWDDTSALQSTMFSIKSISTSSKTAVLPIIPSEKVDEWNSTIDEIIACSEETIDALYELPTYAASIIVAIKAVKRDLSQVKLKKDNWYLIQGVNPVSVGGGYIRGDIVELVQEKINLHDYAMGVKFNKDHFFRTKAGLTLHWRYVKTMIQEYIKAIDINNPEMPICNNKYESFIDELSDQTPISTIFFKLTNEGISLNIDRIFKGDDSLYDHQYSFDESFIYATDHPLTFNGNHFIEDENGISLNIPYILHTLFNLPFTTDPSTNTTVPKKIEYVVSDEPIEPTKHSIIERIDERLLMIVDRVDDGRVVKVKPFMNYALRHSISGLYKTINHTGDGHGLTVEVYSRHIMNSDNIILDDVTNFVPVRPKYNENDLFRLKFENTDNVEIQYEVFVGGKQLSDFYHQKEDVGDVYNALDTIYIDANKADGLKSSHIYIPAENYFVYKIDRMNILDPGAGYAVGQYIFIPLQDSTVKMKVAELSFGVFKGISKVEMISNSIIKGNVNPSVDRAELIYDTMNNIDDEYGTSLNSPYNRNDTFMYPKVTMVDVEPSVENGDPDYHWYQGSQLPFVLDAPEVFDYSNMIDGGVMIPIPFTAGKLNLVIDAADEVYDPSSSIRSDSERFERMRNLVPPTDPFIPYIQRIDYNHHKKSDFQLVSRMSIHSLIETRLNPDDDHIIIDHEGGQLDFNVSFDDPKSINRFIYGDIIVQSYAELPTNMEHCPLEIDRVYVVERDELNDGRRMAYKIYGQMANGDIIYSAPIPADMKWNTFIIRWNQTDYYPDMPSINAQYANVWATLVDKCQIERIPDIGLIMSLPSKSGKLNIRIDIPDEMFRDTYTFEDILYDINRGLYEATVKFRKINTSTYIHDITTNDIAVFNWTLHRWEDIRDRKRWRLDVNRDATSIDHGFTLTYLEEGVFSYDMALYLVKKPRNLNRLIPLKKNAVVSLSASAIDEIDTPAVRYAVNTSKNIVVRKLFPYYQKDTFAIGTHEGVSNYKMNVTINDYHPYRNPIMLQDISIYNRTAKRFEDIRDKSKFRISFKDEKCVDVGMEIQQYVEDIVITDEGSGFNNGIVHGYNQEFDIHITGEVVVNYDNIREMKSFRLCSYSKYPDEPISMDFTIYQNDAQSLSDYGLVIIAFNTKKVALEGDGYVHNVDNPYAIVPKEFMVTVMYELDKQLEYDIIIDKRPDVYHFKADLMIQPEFIIRGRYIPENCLYMCNTNGRFPLINPVTMMAQFTSEICDEGTKIRIIGQTHMTKFEFHSTPYPMRSVYVLRDIPKHGYINMEGKLNKPLNKKYFEFWVNGKLLTDEVTIITPSKLFLHGLTSLKNLEIIEVGRDPDEYFADVFVTNKEAHHSYNFRTYLDDVLEGSLEGDNYSVEEQEYLISPVWRQVSENSEYFMDYPPNTDSEPDILVTELTSSSSITNIRSSYNDLRSNLPRIEGHALLGRSTKFSSFGLVPISNSEIIKLLDEEWEDEINKDYYVNPHRIISNEDWYAMTIRMYNERGVYVMSVGNEAYFTQDEDIIHINSRTKRARIIKQPKEYDLT